MLYVILLIGVFNFIITKVTVRLAKGSMAANSNTNYKRVFVNSTSVSLLTSFWLFVFVGCFFVILHTSSIDASADVSLLLIVTIFLSLIFCFVSNFWLFTKVKNGLFVSSTVFVDKNTKAVIFLFASFSIAVTLMIFGMLLYETIKFFSDVSPVDFFFRVKWYPQSYDYDPHNSFGVVSVFSGTFLISFIAVLIAVPFGIGSAVFISEYIKSDTLKPLVKSVIEVLAGIPTIVYGYFAVYTFSRFLVFLSNITGFDISPESALNAGVVIGIMITPYITSLVYEALNSVPSFLRYSAFAMACTKGEVITKVLIPYSIPQIINASSLAFSRAIGETMIVLMSAGMFANMTLNPFESVTTATVQIVQLLTGDQEFSNPKTMSSFALGFSLFIITLFLNFIALYISKRYEKHHF